MFAVVNALLFIVGIYAKDTETVNQTTHLNDGFVRRLSATNEWISTEQILPRADTTMSVAFWNETFHLFGGNTNGYQFVTVNTVNYSYEWSDYGPTFLTSRHKSRTHSYSQIDATNIVYYIEHLPSIANRIVIYDLESKNEVGDIVSPQNIDPRTCVSQIKDVLYFLGGLFHPSATVQAYNISDQTWIAGVAAMQTERGYHSCVYDPIQEKLWVFGGYDGANGALTKTIETMEITTNVWQYSGILPIASYSHGAIYYRQYILLMGGHNGTAYMDEVQIINCQTGHVFLASPLSYSIGISATVLVTDRVYLFGGTSTRPTGDVYVNTAQYLDLSIQYLLNWDPNATQHPTIIPTADPTTKATINPSFVPTQQPSLVPSSFAPTMAPILHPTPAPTTTPSSFAPTQPPSITPSLMPTHIVSESIESDSIDSVSDEGAAIGGSTTHTSLSSVQLTIITYVSLITGGFILCIVMKYCKNKA